MQHAMFSEGHASKAHESTVAHKPQFYSCIDVNKKGWINCNLLTLKRVKCGENEYEFCDQLVVVPGEMGRQQRETGEDLRVRLERHVDHPVDRQQREDDVHHHEDGALLELVLIHDHPPFPGCRLS